MFLLVFLSIVGVCSGEKSEAERRRDAFISEYILELYPQLADTMRPPKPLDDSRCPANQVMNIDGSCSDVDVTQNIFVYGSAAAEEAEAGRELPAKYRPNLPRPKIEYNVLVIKKDETVNPPPLVIPPPKEKTVVLVLKEKENKEKRKLIEVKLPETKPEVLFVEYKEGENIQLPYGFDLNTVLSASVNQAGKIGHSGSYGFHNGSNFNPWTTSSPIDEYANSFGQSYDLPKVKKEISTSNSGSTNIQKVELKNREKINNYSAKHKNSPNSTGPLFSYPKPPPFVQNITPKSIPRQYSTSTYPPLLPQSPQFVLRNHQPATAESNQNTKIYRRPPEADDYLKNHRISPLTPKERSKIYRRPPPFPGKSPSRSKQRKRMKPASKSPTERENHKIPETIEKETYSDLQNLELSKIKPQVHLDIPVYKNADKKSAPPPAIRLSEKKNGAINKKSPSLSTTTQYHHNEKFSFVPSSRIAPQGGESVPQDWRRVGSDYNVPNTQANTIKRVGHSGLYRLPNLYYAQR